MLVVARKFDKYYPSSIGGVIVSSESLLKYLHKNNVKFDFVDTNKKKYLCNTIAVFIIILNIFKKINKNNHIALNLNEKELFLLGPLVLIASRILRKSISLRVFGGNLNILFEKNIFTRCLLSLLLRNVNILFLQTKFLVRYFPYKNVRFLPTCRNNCNTKLSSINTLPRKYSGKLVFIGQIKESKGVNIILNALKVLDNCVLDFYGPLVDFSQQQLDTSNTFYRGQLHHSLTIPTLSEYDFLVFPTFHSGEGYPGVIIESYAAGTPVITTNWMSIPELVTHGKSGLLIEPKSSNALIEILLNIECNSYSYMRKYAALEFKNYECENVYNSYLKNINI